MLTQTQRRQLHGLLDRVLLAVSNIILPGSGSELYRSFREEKCKNALLGAVIDGIRAAKKGITEGKTLRALMCSTYASFDVKQFLQGASYDAVGEEGLVQEDCNSKGTATDLAASSDEGIQNTVDLDADSVPAQSQDREHEDENASSQFSCHVQGCVIDGHNVVGSATGHNCATCAVPVHLICCQRVLGIVADDSNAELYCSECYKQAFVKDDGDNVTTGTAVTRVTKVSPPVAANKSKAEGNVPKGGRSGAFSKMYQVSRKNWDMLICNGVTCTEVNTRCRREDQDIREALLFIFNPQNVQLLSWGTKRVRVDGKWIDLPAVLRRKTMEHMFRDYKSFIEGKASATIESVVPLGRSSFLDICGAVTRGMQQRKSAVDYVLGSLVYDNLRVVRNVVKGELLPSDNYKLYLKQIDAVEEFIKFTFLEHIGIDTDPVHDQNFSLSLELNET